MPSADANKFESLTPSNPEFSVGRFRSFYGPMESTYQHDFKAPTMTPGVPSFKAGPAPSSVLWNTSANYDPWETTYGHDYKAPAWRDSPALPFTPHDHLSAAVFWNAGWSCGAAPMETTYQHDYKNPLAVLAAKIAGVSDVRQQSILWNVATFPENLWKTTYQRDFAEPAELRLRNVPKAL